MFKISGFRVFVGVVFGVFFGILGYLGFRV